MEFGCTISAKSPQVVLASVRPSRTTDIFPPETAASQIMTSDTASQARTDRSDNMCLMFKNEPCIDIDLIAILPLIWSTKVAVHKIVKVSILHL